MLEKTAGSPLTHDLEKFQKYVSVWGEEKACNVPADGLTFQKHGAKPADDICSTDFLEL